MQSCSGSLCGLAIALPSYRKPQIWYPQFLSARERFTLEEKFRVCIPSNIFKRRNNPWIIYEPTPLHNLLPVESVCSPTHSLANLCGDLKYSWRCKQLHTHCFPQCSLLAHAPLQLVQTGKTWGVTHVTSSKLKNDIIELYYYNTWRPCFEQFYFHQQVLPKNDKELCARYYLPI